MRMVLIHFLKDVCSQKPNICIDIGANEGKYSEYVLEKQFCTPAKISINFVYSRLPNYVSINLFHVNDKFVLHEK